ncbi:MAG: hypothetical protein JWP10_133 [Nocardioidaceae bacterium]|nr:hypothetical protein [Nocardioidaceae bacterium]
MTTVPIPNEVSAIYAVCLVAPLDGLSDHIALPHEDILKAHGATAAQLLRLRGRPHQQVIIARTGVAEEVRDLAFTNRKRALELAEEHDGVAVDLLQSRIITHPSDETSLANASQWVVLEQDIQGYPEVATNGLDQFGLPEARITFPPAENRPMLDAIMMGIAHRLIEEWPQRDPVGPATITLRDIAYGYGQADAATTPDDRHIDVTLTYDDDEHWIDVTLHDDPSIALFS